MKRDRWVLGSSPDSRPRVDQQYDALAGDLLNIYSNDFIVAWRTELAKLRLKKLMADKPKYDALRALSAPTSPLRQILESIREETVLTKERTEVRRRRRRTRWPSRRCSRRRIGSPGAAIEAQFKPFHAVLEGESTRRPIDSVIANLNDIAQNLTLMVENPQMVAQATTSLQTQVAALRNNASRMPPPFSDHAARRRRRIRRQTSRPPTAGQLLQSLRDQVTPVCQQTITNRYPFVRGSTQEVPLGDFAKLFSPNGVIDKFFTQFLAPYADTSRPDWTWREGESGRPSRCRRRR